MIAIMEIKVKNMEKIVLSFRQLSIASTCVGREEVRVEAVRPTQTHTPDPQTAWGSQRLPH